MSWQNYIVNPILKWNVNRQPQKPLSELRLDFELLLGIPASRLHQKFSDSRFQLAKMGGVPCEWVACSESCKDAVILYFHGGGFVMGSINTHRRLALRLSWRTRCKVLLFDYRLAPEHPFPAGMDDAILVYQALLQDYPAERIIFGGESAGAGLLMSTLLQVSERPLPKPLAAFAISPWFDHTLTNDSIRNNRSTESLLNPDSLAAWSDAYRGGRAANESVISPAFASLDDLPPTLLQVSTNEILFDEAVAFEEKAKLAGSDCVLEQWRGVPHAWPLFARWLPEGKAAMNSIADFTTHHLS